MKRGNIIRIAIDRNKYNLPPSTSPHSSILLAKIIDLQKNSVSVQVFDLFASGKFKYLTIKRDEVLSKI